MKQADPATVSGPWRGHPERDRAESAGSHGVPSPDGDARTQFDRSNPAAIHPDGHSSPDPGRLHRSSRLLGDPTGLPYGLRVGIRLVLRDLDRTEGLVAAGDEVGLGARLLGCRGHTLSYPLVNRAFTATCRAGWSGCHHPVPDGNGPQPSLPTGHAASGPGVRTGPDKRERRPMSTLPIEFPYDAPGAAA
jgi:hypothetical protein